MLEDRSQLYSFDSKRGIKTVKTRIGDGLFTVVKTFKDGSREFELFNYNERLIRLEL